jgi:hypothetical protein
MASLDENEQLRDCVADECPVCGATGEELCTEEGGQTVLDHFGRSAGDVPLVTVGAWSR